MPWPLQMKLRTLQANEPDGATLLLFFGEGWFRFSPRLTIHHKTHSPGIATAELQHAKAGGLRSKMAFGDFHHDSDNYPCNISNAISDGPFSATDSDVRILCIL